MGFKYSEVSKKQKKRFYSFLLVFFLGFLVLLLIGDKINNNSFIFTAFLGPLIILVGVIGVVWSLYTEDN